MWFAMVAHMLCAVPGIHTTALKLCIAICIGIHLTQRHTSKTHLKRTFSLPLQLVREQAPAGSNLSHSPLGTIH